MKQYSRIPALIVLILAVGGGALYVWFGRNQGAAATVGIDALEARMAKGEKLSQKDWHAYADAMAARGRHEQAAMGYRGVLATEAGNREAQIGLAVSLAHGRKADELLAYLREMCGADANTVLKILDRPELASCKGDNRFKELESLARAEAMD